MTTGGGPGAAPGRDPASEGGGTNNGPPGRQPATTPSGMTLIELMIGVLVAGILITLAFASFQDYLERARVQEAINDIVTMSALIRDVQMDTGGLPDDLSMVGRGQMRDPWGNLYYYTPLTGHGHGDARKDRRLNPLNSDFDLFSTGKDGVFKSQISHRDSLDDVIRASDGRFVDLASKY
jgi:general secretion pathway protein G